jgi:hypothetical protein
MLGTSPAKKAKQARGEKRLKQGLRRAEHDDEFTESRIPTPAPMNVKQTLILAGSAVLTAIFAYVTFSGHGMQGSEVIPIAIAGTGLAAATLGLVYAFRDQ